MNLTPQQNELINATLAGEQNVTLVASCWVWQDFDDLESNRSVRA